MVSNKVYIDGTWDSMHVGHIAALKKAKSYGDYLVVGVSTDKLARSYRKDGGPMFSYKERKAMVAACRYVDEVIKQTSLVILKQMKKVNPTTYCIGEDWKDKKLAGIEWLKKQPGRKVIYLPRTAGISSTQIRKSIQDKGMLTKLKIDLEGLKKKAIELGVNQAIYIKTEDIIFDDRAILSCYNCGKFKVKSTCPGGTDYANIDYKSLIRSYKHGLIVVYEEKFTTEKEFDFVRKTSTVQLHKMLLFLEKEALNKGYHYKLSFIGGSCKLCDKPCPKTKCRLPNLSRVPIEGAGVDVIKTLKQFTVDIKFPVSGKKKGVLKRVGLLLVE